MRLWTIVEKRLDSIRDLVDMRGYLASDGRVDASRAAVVGGSYGGYAVNAVLANFPGQFVAGASLFGVADWVTALEVASPALKASDRIEYGDIREPRWQEFYQLNSPIRQADRINVPVLYSHGVRDPRIDIAETETMVRSLRRNGIEAPFIRIPDERHGWRKLSNRLFYFRRQAEFLEEKLGLAGAAIEALRGPPVPASSSALHMALVGQWCLKPASRLPSATRCTARSVCTHAPAV